MLTLQLLYTGQEYTNQQLHNMPFIRNLAALSLLTCGLSAAAASYSGTVFIDSNANGLRDPGERVMPDVRVSDGLHVVATDRQGRFTLPGHEREKFIFVTTPSGYYVPAGHYHRIDPKTGSYDFGLVRYDAHVDRGGDHRFIHITDTEIFNTDKNELWVDDLRKYVDNEGAAFIVHTGDICYEKGLREHIGLMNTANMGLPVHYTLGNHDLVKGKYGEELFESIYGPVYYSFDAGNTHYIVTPMAGGDHKPSYTTDQIAEWMAADLEHVDPSKSVVVFNHDILTDGKSFIYGGKNSTVDLNAHNLKAWIYGHWHINHKRLQGDVYTICTSTPDKGGIDHSTSVSRIVDVDGKGNITTGLHYLYLHDHAVVASPKGMTSSSEVVVNAYSSTAKIKSVTAVCSVGDKRLGKPFSLSQATDWTWTAPLPRKALDASENITLDVTVTYSDGSTSKASSEFRYISDGVKVTPGADWTNLLGNASHTGGNTSADVDTLPALAWTTNVGANIFMTSPLVFDGKIFTASVDEDMKGQAAIYALDANDGHRVWKYPVTSSIKNTIAIGAGLVFAQDVDGMLYAVRCSDGALAWKSQLPVRSVPALIEGLCATDSVVFAGSGKGLSAFEASTGRLLWRNNAWNQGEGTTTTLAEGNGVVVAGVQWSALYGNDAHTGRHLWSLSAHGLSDRGASAAIHDGLAYIISRESVFVINVADGRIILRRKLPMKVDVTSTPLLTDGLIVFGSSTNGLVALDRETFDVKWTTPMSDALVYTGPYTRPVSATVETSPVMANGRIYVGASDGTVYGIDPADGSIAWSYALGAPVFGSVAVSGNMLVAVDLGGNVYCFATPVD